MKLKLFIILLCIYIYNPYISAQSIQEKIRQFISQADNLKGAGITRVHELQDFYQFTDYLPAWLGPEREGNRIALLKLLKSAGSKGLNERDYHYEFVYSLIDNLLLTSEDTLITDLKFTDAAIHFFGDLAYGNTKPVFGFEGMNYTPQCYNIAQMIAEHYKSNRLDALPDVFATRLPEIKLTEEKLNRLEAALNSNSYKEEKITSNQVSHFNKPLVKKLYALGISDSSERKSDQGIKENLKEAQKQLNLLSDGVLRSTTLAALNIPLEMRIKQLKLSLNYYRWLSCLSQQEPVVIVNIPATYLKVYSPGGILLEMKMVVGSPSTPTPTLTSFITEVILYPYWMVPHSIVTKELLPAIKRDPGYVDANNFQVITPQGKIADPYKIDWQLLNASNFPYIIRQSTGCDNALGIIKLNFYNPYNVYLHDTPYKSLFSLNRRYFSHGCMRMEKPIELGRLALKNNTIAVDTLEEAACLLNQKPVVVPADEKLKVVVWYNPVGIDSDGRVIFYEDVYKKFR